MLLYHYSNKDINGKLKIDYFGNNHYSNNSKKESNLKRLYFYTNKKDKEIFFNGSNFLYIVKIDRKKLYNFEIDKQKIFEKSGFNFDNAINTIKSLGFCGIIGNNGYKIVCLFTDIDYNRKETLSC